MRRHTFCSVVIGILLLPAACEAQRIVLQGKIKLQGNISLGPVVPYVSSLSPNYGPANTGTTVTIGGTGFGTTQGIVTFNGVQGTVTNWSATSVTATSPTTVTTGYVVVTVGGVASNGLSFTVTGGTTSQVTTGSPPFGSFGGGPFDSVDNANLNVSFAIPILNKAGRGLPFSYALAYSSSIWSPVGQQWTPAGNWGWGAISTANTGYVGYAADSMGPIPCWYQGVEYYYSYTDYPDWVYYDPGGTPHNFQLHLDSSISGYPVPGGNWSNCNPAPNLQPSQGTAPASDGSGYGVSASAYTSPSATATVYSPSGTTINVPLQAVGGTLGSCPSGGIGCRVTDTNGNYVYTPDGLNFYDTLSSATPVLSASTTQTSATYTYTNPLGGSSYYTVNYSQYTVETNFGCYGVTDYGRTQQQTAYLVSSISLPDGTSYSIAYELTPNPIHPGAFTGRIASITLPTGGVISYNYNGKLGISCTDGSPVSLARTTPDGTWVYTRPVVNPTGYQETQVTDPVGNQQDYFFQGLYETERVYYQGTIAQQQALQTVYTCYGGASYPCNNTAITQQPITRRTVWSSIGGLMSEADTQYDSTGSLPTDVKQYNFGLALARETVTQYNTTLGNNILNRPSTVTVKDGSGNTLTTTTYTYDCNTYSNPCVTQTTGTPQHQNPSGARGNLTQTQTAAQTVTITQSWSYYDTGMVNTVTDGRGNQAASYTFGSASCGNSFPTTVGLAMSLSVSYTWYCNGGAVNTSTDANNQQTTFSYDSMWRPTQTSYPTGGGTATTTYTLENLIDSTRTLTGSVTLHNEASLDGLGRALKATLVSDPTGADYVDTTYDALGRTSTVSNPYRSTSDPTLRQQLNFLRRSQPGHQGDPRRRHV